MSSDAPLSLPDVREDDKARRRAAVPTPTLAQAIESVGTDVAVVRDVSVGSALQQLIALRANAAQRLRRLQKEAAETAAFLDTLKTFGMRRDAQKHLLRLYEGIRKETALLREMTHDVLEAARALGMDIGLPNDDAPSTASAAVDGKPVVVTQATDFARS